MKNFIFVAICIFFFLSQIVNSKISEVIARGFYQECLQTTKEVTVNNKMITAKKIENYCICSVNELDKLVDDKTYEELMLKYHKNVNYKAREFDIILNACTKYLN